MQTHIKAQGEERHHGGDVVTRWRKFRKALGRLGIGAAPCPVTGEEQAQPGPLGLQDAGGQAGRPRDGDAQRQRPSPACSARGSS